MVRNRHTHLLRGAAVSLLAVFLMFPGGRVAASPGSVAYTDALGKQITVSPPVRRAVFFVLYGLHSRARRVGPHGGRREMGLR